MLIADLQIEAGLAIMKIKNKNKQDLIIRDHSVVRVSCDCFQLQYVCSVFCYITVNTVIFE